MVTLSLNKAIQSKDPYLYSIISKMVDKNMLNPMFVQSLNGSPDSIWYLRQNWNVEEFKEHVCPDCMITIYGPKKLLFEHHKVCKKVADKYKENEVIIGRYHEYSYRLPK